MMRSLIALARAPARNQTLVTLLVLPEEAELLAEAQSSGVLRLAIRNPKDLDDSADDETRRFTSDLTLFPLDAGTPWR